MSRPSSSDGSCSALAVEGEVDRMVARVRVVVVAAFVVRSLREMISPSSGAAADREVVES